MKGGTMKYKIAIIVAVLATIGAGWTWDEGASAASWNSGSIEAI